MLELPSYGDTDERMLRSHLSLVHGVYVRDVKTAEGLVECHEDQHANPDPHFQLPHSHTEAVIMEDPPEEWVW